MASRFLSSTFALLPQRGVFVALRALLTATFVFCLAAHADAIELKPFKDDLFAYPATLSSGDNGAYTVIDYRELRDINDRDEVPERRVHAQYTDTSVRKVQQDLLLKTVAGDVRHVAVGKTEGAGIIVLYLHGQGGSRKQGVDDFTFGGNFNRIKNLMAGNGGLYLSPGLFRFRRHRRGPGRGVDGSLCRGLTGRENLRRLRLDGRRAVLEAGRPQRYRPTHQRAAAARFALGREFLEPRLQAPVPVFFGQGSKDPVFPVEKQEAFFRSIIAKSKAIRIRPASSVSRPVPTARRSAWSTGAAR